MEPSVGSRFGRYRILGRLGTGGMGVVVSAHDPELDRSVAIKILRRDRPAVDSKPIEHTVRLRRDASGAAGGAARDPRREQLLAEARVVARLSHPNLVSVFEVGEMDGQAFLVMELIEGQTLTRWLGKKRSVGEIVGAFVQAGRGLAAAHAAGLVHGDFKPDNALVDDAGRVRVIDFGVARASGADAIGGRVLGTPRYMAPEQLAGRPVDARADQFALCVALYEALYGQSPFPDAKGAAAPARERLARKPCRPTGPRGPALLERAVLRGLARDPALRFRSTDELLAALERALRHARAVPMAALAFVVATGAGITAAVLAGGREIDPCDGVEESIAGVWGPAVAAQVSEAFAASGRPHAQASYERTRVALDSYAGSWIRARRSSCRAARSGEASRELVDRRTACLDSRRLRLEVLIRNLAHADDLSVDQAVQMTADLEPLDACNDGESLLAGVPPPADPGVRAELAALERQVADADMSHRAGRLASAEGSTRALLVRARALDHAPLLASVARLHGRILDELGRPADARDALFEAVRAAERASQTTLAIESLIDLIRIVGLRLADRVQAGSLAKLASAILERPATRDDLRLRASLLSAEGLLEQEAANYGHAVELHRRVLTLRRTALPPDHLDIASAESNLGNSLVRQTRFAEGREHLDRGLAIMRGVFGDDHPKTAGIVMNVGVSYYEEGRLDEARRLFLQALHVFERMPEARTYPAVLSNLGNVELQLGRFDEARRHYEEAAAIRRSRLNPDHPDVAASLYSLASLYSDLGDYKRALETHRNALDIRRRALGEEDPWYGHSLSATAWTLRLLGRPRQALELAETGLAVLIRRIGVDHPRTGFAHLSVGAALVDLGRHRDAFPALERAIALLTADDPDRALAQFHLARALAATGQQAEAAELADQARKKLGETNRKRDIAILDAWAARSLRR